MIHCTKCNKQVSDCVCPDCDDKLKKLANASHVAFKWCRTCDKHYARCKCATPEFFVIAGGVEWPMPKGGYENAAGGRTIPDMKQR